MFMDNPFTPPDDGWTFTVGKPTRIEWNATTKGKVTLWLRHSDGGAGWTIPIAENIPNSGEYKWTPTPDLEPESSEDGTTYTLLIGPGGGDPDTSTNQILITVNGSGTSSATTTNTDIDTPTSSSPIQSTSSIPESTVTMTVTGDGGSISTTLATASTSLPSESPPPVPGGLSSDFKIGIGVGVGLGVPTILFLLGFILWKRLRPSSTPGAKAKEDQNQPSMVELSSDDAAKQRAELCAQERAEMSARERVELGEGKVTYELPGNDIAAAELAIKDASG
ncbi:GPI anchored serine-threonine rich family protein [Aspergillus puulaauensis]|uniref:Yeast cell wall synthesis Kre9/Knh1-like N-terminal domain-containing protein n=1 Tax=Aspergillus puulaauensis TaxID=1220207 RepID=A0A7R7XVQ1_9EURO|nr:uncharacterized protein APUU_60861A [Aspergillus puulaauensis]BCS27813.1 hypothetical protein APUU_60861A [Aspergillus puulaauensis]